MCVDWIFYILCYVNWIYIESDCYVNCLLRNGELKWMWMTCFEIDWLVNCYWEWCECGICWVEGWDIDLCWRLKNDLSYEIVDWKFMEMDWSDELCEFLVFNGNELVV